MRYQTPATPASEPHILAVIDANPKLGSSAKDRYEWVVTGYLDAGDNLPDAEEAGEC